MVFLLELTHDLNALPALTAGTVAALCVTVLLLRRSILTEKLARRGQHIARDYSVDIFELGRVAEVMDHTPPIIPAHTTVAALTARIAGGDAIVSRRQAVLIADQHGSLAGIITRGDLLRAQGAENGGNTPVLDAGSRQVVVTFPDETLRDAIAQMLRHDVGRLAVVDRKDPRRILGYL